MVKVSTQPRQIFILSPASCSGQRATLLFNERAQFFLARRLREQGAPLGEVFSFLSGLYFRGKLTYARAFSQRPVEHGTPRRALPTIGVITAGRGLVDPEAIVRLEDLRAFAAVPIDAREPRYREPLVRDAAALAAKLPAAGRAVLLGSIASDKYVEILHEAFGERLVFPQAFVGRGDMSRGGLLLRAVDEGEELTYVPVIGSLRRGVRPERLKPRQRGDGRERGQTGERESGS
jgi:hypothetical protein